MGASIAIMALLLLHTTGAAGLAQPTTREVATTPERIVITGSKTLQPVVKQWAQEYGRTHPGVGIVVKGGGTDRGFEQLIAGESQIAMAAREISDTEREAAKTRGVTIEEHIVARAGVSVLKNKKNPVRELDTVQVRRIFDGSAKSWREVGGPAEPITVILRHPSSHTADFFRRVVVAPSALTEQGIVVGTQEEVVQEVTTRPWAIGFADFDRALSHLDEVEVLRVRTSSGPAKLVFVRSLCFYARQPLCALVKGFIAFTTSPRGSEIAVLHSYFEPDDPS